MRIRANETHAGLDIVRHEEARPSLVTSLVNDALAKLTEPELEAVLLRLVDGYTFVELGRHFETTEEAARKKFNRALEKLRGWFGVTGVDRTLNQTKGTLRTMLTEVDIVRAIDARYTGLDNIMHSRDADAVRAYASGLYTDDFRQLDASGQTAGEGSNIEGFVSYIVNRPQEIERKHEVELVEFASNTAVVSVKLEVTRSDTPSFRSRFKDTWKNIDGDWRLAVTQGLGREEFTPTPP